MKKPGCGDEIMAYFKAHPEVGVTHPSQIAVVGDRLMTDMMLANMMGSWGLWIKDGVKPLSEKSVVCNPRRYIFHVYLLILPVSFLNSNNALSRSL